jgi:O-antigen ligase
MIFYLGSFLLIPSVSLKPIKVIYLCAGYLGGAVIFMGSILELEWFGRASATSAPLVIMLILSFSISGSNMQKKVSLLCAFLVLAAVSFDTSRMATLVSFILIFAWIAFFSSWRAWVRVILLLSMTALELYFWLYNSFAYERIFGRDASLPVGPILINGEGRTEAATILTSEPTTPLDVLFGQGLGWSGSKLVSVGFGLDKPHNEFLRLFFDLGVLGLWAWTLTLLWLLFLAYRASKSQVSQSETFLFAGTFLVLLGFSLSDNVLSYSWVMAPCGILVAWERSSISPINWSFVK